MRSASSRRKITATISAGFTSGRVTLKNTLTGWMPSIFAASYMSRGIICRPARQRSAMNGVVFQMSTIRTAYIAVSTLAVQAIFWSMIPRLISMSLTMPNWSLKSHAQSLAETMVGIAQGMRMAARTIERP